MLFNPTTNQVITKIRQQKKEALLCPNKENIFNFLSLEIYKSRESKRTINFYRKSLNFDLQSDWFWNFIGVALKDASYFD